MLLPQILVVAFLLSETRLLLADVGMSTVRVIIDGLTERTGLTVPVLSSMLLRMELEGEVVANPGGTYSRCAGSG